MKKNNNPKIYKMNQIFLNSIPNFSLFSLLIKKPILLTGVVPAIAISKTVDFYGVVTCLFLLFLIDLVSGLSASYFEWKKTAKKGKYFFGNDQGFSSDKFKKCFIKGIVYGMFPLVILKFQQVFMLKKFSISYITEAQIDITTAILLLFCANEIFSIFWENLPKCGLNIPRGVRELIFGIKKVAEESN